MTQPFDTEWEQAEIAAECQRRLAATAWMDLPKEVLDDMEWLGNFGPTVKPENRELKGCMVDGDGDLVKAYIEADFARRLAKSLTVVADWLDARAEAAKDSP